MRPLNPNSDTFLKIVPNRPNQYFFLIYMLLVLFLLFSK